MPTSKKFLERLHQILDDMDVSTHPKERADAFAAMFGLKTQKAKLILNGSNPPTSELLSNMAVEFEVEPDWLTGTEPAPSAHAKKIRREYPVREVSVSSGSELL